MIRIIEDPDQKLNWLLIGIPLTLFLLDLKPFIVKMQNKNKNYSFVIIQTSSIDY